MKTFRIESDGFENAGCSFGRRTRQKMKEIDSPLAVELANLPKGEKGNRPSERLEYLPVYSFFFSLIVDFSILSFGKTLTDEVMKAREACLRESDSYDCPRGEQHDCRHYLYLGHRGAGPY